MIGKQKFIAHGAPLHLGWVSPKIAKLAFEHNVFGAYYVDRISQKKVSFQLDPVESTSIKGLKAEKEIGKTSRFQDNYERPFPSKTQAPKDPIVEHEDGRQTDARKAFTGLVVEHGVSEVSDNVKGLNTSQVSESKPSRPVSRFKMQKANR